MFIHVSHRPSDGGRLPTYMALYDDLCELNLVDSSESLVVYTPVSDNNILPASHPLSLPPSLLFKSFPQFFSHSLLPSLPLPHYSNIPSASHFTGRAAGASTPPHRAGVVPQSCSLKTERPKCEAEGRERGGIWELEGLG